MRLRNHLLLAAFVVLIGSLAIAQNSSSTANPFHWKGTLNAGQMLTIKNINGDIRAEGTPGNQVEITATKSGEGADQVRIEVVQSSEGIGVCAIYPDSDSTCTVDPNWSTHSHGNNNHDRARVEFTVHVPQNVKLMARNINGGVEAKNLGEVADATSVNGSVEVSTTHWAHLSSVNGSVTGHFGKADWSDKLNISTVNGNITLALPADASTDVEFQSVNGRLKTDLPLTIQSSSGEFGPKHMRGTIGGGGRSLKLNTVNGSVNLEKNSM
jgi:DUF4097 and DUF4098 domain-containing protein YvlB